MAPKTCQYPGCGQTYEGEGSFCDRPDHFPPNKVRGYTKVRMSQSEVIKHFAQRFEMKQSQAKAFFEELSNLAAQEVKASGEFVLPGFGKLIRSKRKAREGRNPATGEAVRIPAKTTLKFRVGKSMKDTILPKK